MTLRIAALLLVCISLTACSHGRFNPFWAKPASLDIMNGPPGPPEFEQGYRDGCESGFKAYSSQYNKVWWTFRQDATLRTNPVYYQIWKDAYAYCAQYANSADSHGFANYGDMDPLSR